MSTLEETEPQFAPEGEPDEYRDAFQYERFNTQDHPERFICTVTIGSDRHRVNPDQARHILAYLSESSQKDNA